MKRVDLDQMLQNAMSDWDVPFSLVQFSQQLRVNTAILFWVKIRIS